MPHVHKKQLARKRIFVQTTFKLEQKIFTQQNHSFFRYTSRDFKYHEEAWANLNTPRKNCRKRIGNKTAANESKSKSTKGMAV